MVSGYTIIEKLSGETPLAALERFRATRTDLANAPMTYAGRLDPLASGKLIILYGDECKNKEQYLGLDKEYEVEIILGIETDTYDVLGLVTKINSTPESIPDFDKYIGKFEQTYPPYSSKTVEGKQLHVHAREGTLPEEMPTKEVEIYSIDVVEKRKIAADELCMQIKNLIDAVNGDFRQTEIKKKWADVLGNNSTLSLVKIKVASSSGTYMRSLAHAVGGCTLLIHRTKIGKY